jgi:hypothetical protein
LPHQTGVSGDRDYGETAGALLSIACSIRTKPPCQARQ